MKGSLQVLLVDFRHLLLESANTEKDRAVGVRVGMNGKQRLESPQVEGLHCASHQVLLLGDRMY